MATTQDTNDNVVTRIQDVTSLTGQAMEGAEGFLGSLRELGSINPPYTIPGEATFSPTMPQIDAEAPDSVTDQVLDIVNTETGTPPDPSDYGITKGSDITAGLETDIAALEEVSGPSASDFTYTEVEDEYQSPLLDALIDKILTVIQGGTYLDPAAEDAAWRRDYERRQLALQESIDGAAYELAARGWSMPPGVFNDMVETIYDKDRMDQNTRSRDITYKQLDIAFQSAQAALGLGVNVENMLIAHFDRFKDRALLVAKTIIEMGIAIMNARLQRIIAIVDAKKTIISAEVDIERLKIEKLSAAVTVYAKKVEAVLMKARTLIDTHASDVDFFRAAVTRAEAYARVNLETGRISTENMQANVRSFLESARINLEAFIQAAQLKANVANAGANIYASWVTAAQNSLNTVVQLASSGMTTKSE